MRQLHADNEGLGSSQKGLYAQRSQYGKPSHTGFTIIELMSVLLTLGLLAAIAIPAYHDYMIRSRVTELVNVSSYAKTAVSDYRINHGSMPNSNNQAGVSNVITSFVSSLTVSTGGVITITGNQTNLGTGGPLSVVLTPTYSDGAVSWICTSTGASQYVPASCR